MGGGPDQTFSNRLRENAKLMVRGMLHRVDLELSRDPYSRRLARSLQSFEVDTVLDIGANVGQFALMLRRAGFAGHIISCEPLSGAYAGLSARARRDDRWTALNLAVGRESSTTLINVSANSYSSSLRPMTDAHRTNAPGSDYISSEEVEVTTVIELVAAQAVDPTHTLLKVDTQGFEEEVLAGAGDLVGEIAAIQLELSTVELYEGQQLFEDLYRRLHTAGYRLWALEPGFAGDNGRMLQCDGLFARTALFGD